VLRGVLPGHATIPRGIVTFVFIPTHFLSGSRALSMGAASGSAS
jgi:hypothetical protein